MIDALGLLFEYVLTGLEWLDTNKFFVAGFGIALKLLAELIQFIRAVKGPSIDAAKNLSRLTKAKRQQAELQNCQTAKDLLAVISDDDLGDIDVAEFIDLLEEELLTKGDE